jgi:hypothetical protein
MVNHTDLGSRGGHRHMSTLERLMAQGQWTETELPDGRKLPSFVMPTSELQIKLEDALEAKIRKRLKAAGYRRVCGPSREHPFHSDLLRERVDDLAEHLWPTELEPEFASEESIEALRECLRDSLIPGTKLVPVTECDVDAMIESGRTEFRRVWAKSFEKYRDMRKNDGYWRGTYPYQIMFPPEGPPLPDGPPPAAVYIKGPTDLVMSLNDGAIALWVKV